MTAAGSTAGADGSRSRFTRALLPAIVLLAALAYALTAPHRILGGDNGEFSALYAAGGIAHPPGYPSMVLWLRLCHWLWHGLPIDTPAHGAALATVILGAMGVWTVQRACLAWGASTGATAFASVVYAFSPEAWRMSCHAEAFAMNAMFAGAILALSAPEARLRDWKQTSALGVLAGVAIGDHQSIVFLAPVGLLAAARAVREAKRPRVAALVGLPALCLGIVLPYVYVYVVARTSDPQTTPMWIEAPTLAGVLFHFRRGAYGTFSLGSAPVVGQAPGHLILFAKGCVRQMLGMPFVVLLAAGVALTRREHQAIPARVLRSRLALGAAFALAGPLFVASFNLPLWEAGPIVAERFFLLPEVILTVMGALSIDALVPWLMARDGLVAALSVQAGLAAAIVTVPEVLEYERPTVAIYIENTLRAAPPDAILVGSGDHRWGGFMYARYALHMRPDVLFLLPDLMAQAWYRRDMQVMTGASFETPAHGPVGPKTLMARLLATGRPLFYTDWPNPVVAGTPHYTVGTLMRVLRDGESPPAPRALEAMNVEAFSRYEIEPTLPADVNGWGYSLQGDYARAWGELGRAYGEEGDIADEQECYARAAAFAPWRVGVTKAE